MIEETAEETQWLDASARGSPSALPYEPHFDFTIIAESYSFLKMLLFGTCLCSSLGIHQLYGNVLMDLALPVPWGTLTMGGTKDHTRNNPA